MSAALPTYSQATTDGGQKFDAVRQDLAHFIRTQGPEASADQIWKPNNRLTREQFIALCCKLACLPPQEQQEQAA